MIKLHVDTSEAQRKAKRAVDILREKNHKAGKLAARVHAYHAFQYTVPISAEDNAWRFNKMAERIRKDVEKTHGVRWEEGWQWKGFAVLQEEKGEKVAKEFWSKYKADTEGGKKDRDQTGLGHKEYFDKQRVRKTAAEDKYLAYRKSQGYRIPRKPRIMGIVSREHREKLIAKRHKTMGLAKAGWFAAARKTGGRGYQVTGGSDANRRVFPKQVKTPFRIFGGTSLGSAKVMSSQQGFRYAMRNRVRYAGDEQTFPEFGMTKAAMLTRRYMQINLAQRLKHGALWRDSRTAKAA